MNSKIEQIINEVTQLSSFEVNSVLGALRYNLLFKAITKTIAQLPDAPGEAPGLDPAAQFEKNMMLPEIKEQTAPLLGMAERIQDALHEYGTQPPTTLEKVLELTLNNRPSRAMLQREFETRKARGQEPSGGVRRFVDDKFRQAEQRYATMKAKGEIAIKMLHGIDGVDGHLDEIVIDALIQKAEDKMATRWYAQDDRSTDSMVNLEGQLEAEASRDLIAVAMTKLGFEPPKVPESRGTPHVEVEKFPYQRPMTDDTDVLRS